MAPFVWAGTRAAIEGGRAAGGPPPAGTNRSEPRSRPAPPAGRDPPDLRRAGTRAAIEGGELLEGHRLPEQIARNSDHPFAQVAATRPTFGGRAHEPAPRGRICRRATEDKIQKQKGATLGSPFTKLNTFTKTSKPNRQYKEPQ